LKVFYYLIENESISNKKNRILFMGIFRKSGKVIGNFLFVVCLSFFITFLSISEFIDYENMKSTAVEMIAPQITKNIDPTQLRLVHQQLLENCTKQEKVNVSLEDQMYEIKCSEIRNSKPEDLGGIIAGAVFDKNYYREYGCTFLDCMDILKKDPMLIMSSKTKGLINKMILYLAMGTALGATLILLCIETWSGKLKNIGISCIVIGIGYFLIIFTKDILLKKIPIIELNISDMINPLFDSLSSKLLIVLIIGILITIIGFAIGLKFKKKEK